MSESTAPPVGSWGPGWSKVKQLAWHAALGAAYAAGAGVVTLAANWAAVTLL
ncbi:hypothetical protein [Streptomyces sp. NPDC055912]|uniref:hypothetical protein n=1 Tax=unclassified Streptomyces TaxID=2593676 RepID=UPI0035D99238